MRARAYRGNTIISRGALHSPYFDVGACPLIHEGNSSSEALVPQLEKQKKLAASGAHRHGRWLDAFAACNTRLRSRRKRET